MDVWLILFILGFLIIYPYIIYPCILLFFPKMDRANSTISPVTSVSLFIAAYNEEKVIAQKLENSLELDWTNLEFEIVVGSDGSTDKTNEIVEKYASINPEIRLLKMELQSGKVNVLNKGIPLCKGEIILLSDANAMYNKECVQKIIPHFMDSNVGCVAGEKRMVRRGEEISQNEGVYWKLESKIKQLEDKVSTVIGADGACYAIRKNLFEQLPRNTAVDDFLNSMWIVQKGYRIAYEPDAYSCEDAGTTLQQELKRKTRIASGNFYNLRFLTEFLKPSRISFLFISHKLLRWISPFILILFTLTCVYLSFFNWFGIFMTIILLVSYIVTFIKYHNPNQKMLRNKFLNLLMYFYMTVMAQFLGFVTMCKGNSNAIWNTIRN